jgi:hypothetical protein
MQLVLGRGRTIKERQDGYQAALERFQLGALDSLQVGLWSTNRVEFRAGDP